jgi:hypothetical protein
LQIVSSVSLGPLNLPLRGLLRLLDQAVGQHNNGIAVEEAEYSVRIRAKLYSALPYLFGADEFS